jgi:hypothetical protein
LAKYKGPVPKIETAKPLRILCSIFGKDILFFGKQHNKLKIKHLILLTLKTCSCPLVGGISNNWLT